ncbi:SDR family oxidoreductase [Streptomyces sp. ST2-7A]|uniref:SDR family oxidoreductase n=1 Tax=Streptomyces sp. ST2-7A TaxID=2907214 RepID=UPI001F4797C1|nr:SDR family oxidoreductase [Streptomyces sp. ST2-7A]MCE7078943.1 SDR family oxidoreductase [Streptomyces sp. ST2-7A]
MAGGNGVPDGGSEGGSEGGPNGLPDRDTGAGAAAATGAAPGARVAVVTGAARGIGELLVRKLSGRGLRVALVGLEPERMREVADSLPGPALVLPADVTDPAAMREAALRVREGFGRVDVVVANAGVATGGRFTESDDATWRRVIEVNLIGSAATCRAFLPDLVESRGYFLQVASLAAIVPAPMMTAYCASKSGAEAFAHALRAEVGPLGVDVGVGYLSWTDTDMVRGADADPVLGGRRSNLPWPANRTYPAGPAVDRLVAGIERRAAHVYGQRWLRGMQLVRPLLPAVMGTLGAREVARSGPTPAAGPAPGLVGAGGAADDRERAGAKAAPEPRPDA